MNIDNKGLEYWDDEFGRLEDENESYIAEYENYSTKNGQWINEINSFLDGNFLDSTGQSYNVRDKKYEMAVESRREEIFNWLKLSKHFSEVANSGQFVILPKTQVVLLSGEYVNLPQWLIEEGFFNGMKILGYTLKIFVGPQLDESIMIFQRAIELAPFGRSVLESTPTIFDSNFELTNSIFEYSQMTEPLLSKSEIAKLQMKQLSELLVKNGNEAFGVGFNFLIDEEGHDYKMLSQALSNEIQTDDRLLSNFLNIVREFAIREKVYESNFEVWLIADSQTIDYRWVSHKNHKRNCFNASWRFNEISENFKSFYSINKYHGQPKEYNLINSSGFKNGTYLAGEFTCQLNDDDKYITRISSVSTYDIGGYHYENDPAPPFIIEKIIQFLDSLVNKIAKPEPTAGESMSGDFKIHFENQHLDVNVYYDSIQKEIGLITRVTFDKLIARACLEDGWSEID